MKARNFALAAVFATMVACQNNDGETQPSSSSEAFSSSSSVGSNTPSSSSSSLDNALCIDFAEGTAREHYEKSKPQFCDKRDGKKYVYVVIGTQTWMAENLNYEAEGSLCYENDEANCEIYGRLYEWEIAKRVCPDGWHLPRNEEWSELFRFVDSQTAGKHLKAKSGWNTENPYGAKIENLDTYGFTALPGGYSLYDRFYMLGRDGWWWSTNEYYNYDASNGASSMYHNTDYAYSESVRKEISGLRSVRCIRNL